MKQDDWLKWAVSECEKANIIRLDITIAEGARLRTEALVVCGLCHHQANSHVGVIYAPFAGWREDAEQKGIQFDTFESGAVAVAGIPSVVGRNLEADWLRVEMVQCIVNSHRLSLVSEFSFLALQQFQWLLGMIEQRLSEGKLSGINENLFKTVSFRLRGLIAEGNRLYVPLFHGI